MVGQVSQSSVVSLKSPAHFADISGSPTLPGHDCLPDAEGFVVRRPREAAAILRILSPGQGALDVSRRQRFSLIMPGMEVLAEPWRVDWAPSRKRMVPNNREAELSRPEWIVELVHVGRINGHGGGRTVRACFFLIEVCAGQTLARCIDEISSLQHDGWCVVAPRFKPRLLA